MATRYNDPPCTIEESCHDIEWTKHSNEISQQSLFRGESIRYISGTIEIPATAFVEPIAPDGTKVLTMDSYLGGTQLHLEQDGSVVYKLPPFVPFGFFRLTARVVNIHRQQVPLLVSIDYLQGSKEYSSNRTAFEIQVPYTGGTWCTTKPTEIIIGAGVHLRITRSANCHGLTIKDFFLQPSGVLDSA